MIDLENHPEFPESVHTLISDSVFALLEADVNLVGFFIDEIREVQSEELRQLGTKKTPSLWVYLFDDVEEPQLSRTALVSTTIEIILVANFGKYTGTRQHLFRRILAYIQGLIHQELDLRDTLGNQLTDSVILFNRVEAAEIEDTDTFVMILQAVFSTTIEQERQLPIGHSGP